jgi:hypothetical protein
MLDDAAFDCFCQLVRWPSLYTNFLWSLSVYSDQNIVRLDISYLTVKVTIFTPYC